MGYTAHSSSYILLQKAHKLAPLRRKVDFNHVKNFQRPPRTQSSGR